MRDAFLLEERVVILHGEREAAMEGRAAAEAREALLQDEVPKVAPSGLTLGCHLLL